MVEGERKWLKICLMASSGISRVESSGSATRMLVSNFLKHNRPKYMLHHEISTIFVTCLTLE